MDLHGPRGSVRGLTRTPPSQLTFDLRVCTDLAAVMQLSATQRRDERHRTLFVVELVPFHLRSRRM